MINLHVLLVDDEPDLRKIVVAALALDPFFIVRGCGSARRALTAAVEWRPDLVLLDVEMPDLDGPAVLARLRADRRTAPIPVVFLTGRGGARARKRKRLKELGAAGVIEKRLEPMTLAAALRRFVAVEGVLAPARKNFLQRLKADARAGGLPAAFDADPTAAEERSPAHQSDRAFARRRRRHLRFCRYHLRIRRALGRRRKQSRRARQADRGRARPRPPARAHRATLARASVGSVPLIPAKAGIHPHCECG